MDHMQEIANESYEALKKRNLQEIERCITTLQLLKTTTTDINHCVIETEKVITAFDREMTELAENEASFVMDHFETKKLLAEAQLVLDNIRFAHRGCSTSSEALTIERNIADLAQIFKEKELPLTKASYYIRALNDTECLVDMLADNVKRERELNLKTIIARNELKELKNTVMETSQSAAGVDEKLAKLDRARKYKIQCVLDDRQ